MGSHFFGDRCFRVTESNCQIYHSISEENDIAIITLTKDVTFNKASIPACLSKLAEPNANAIATTVGWGLTSYDGVQSRYLNSTYSQLLY